MNCVIRPGVRAVILTVCVCLFYPLAFAGNRDAEKESITTVPTKLTPKDFSWNAKRKLSWNDFRGPMTPSAENKVAAVTFCSIGLETMVDPGAKRPRIEVFNLFHPERSWSRDHMETPEVLAHEQCHFDICELFTRKLEAKLAAAHITVDNMETVVNSIYEEIQREYNNFQEQYENETHHGLITDQQKNWEARVATALTRR